VLFLAVSTPQEPDLHLYLSTLQRPVLLLEVSTPQGPELHLDVSALRFLNKLSSLCFRFFKKRAGLLRYLKYKKYKRWFSFEIIFYQK
jgi:hypothetical protein